MWDNFRYKVQLIALCSVTVISVFAALPLFINSKVYKMALLAAWVLNFICNMLFFKFSFTRRNILLLSFWLGYVIYCTVMYMLRGEGYIYGVYFYNICLSIFIFINGCFLSHEQRDRVFNYIIPLFIVCTLAVTFYIYMTNFHGINYLNALMYIYASKNSIGPIVVCCITSLLVMDVKKTAHKALRYGAMAFFVYFLLLLNNRAGVVELATVLFCFTFLIKKEKKPVKDFKRGYIVFLLSLMCCSAAGAVLIFYWDTISQKAANMLRWSLQLEKLTSLDRFSSGRLTLCAWTVKSAVSVSPIFGVGRWYLDFLYLSVVAELGIAGAVPVFAILGIIFYASLKNMRSPERHMKLLGLICVQMLVATLFEALPPFGPGTVVFLLWLLLGAWASSKDTSKIPLKDGECNNGQEIPF